MKRRIWAIGLAATCLLLGIVLLRPQPMAPHLSERNPLSGTRGARLLDQSTAPVAGLANASPRGAAPRPNPGGVPIRRGATAAQTHGIAAVSVDQEPAAASDKHLLGVKSFLRDYRAAFHQNPVGNNAEITKALLGANPTHSRFLPPQAEINAAGQLVDQWGHPYFFHQISGIQMEVRSAGPDGVMWTADDEATR